MSRVQDFEDYHRHMCTELQTICDYTCSVDEVLDELAKVKSVCKTCKTELETYGYSISSTQIAKLQQDIKDAHTEWNKNVGTAEMKSVYDHDRGYSYELLPGAKNRVIYDVTKYLGTCSDRLNAMYHCLRIIKERSHPTDVHGKPAQAHIQTLICRMKKINI